LQHANETVCIKYESPKMCVNVPTINSAPQFDCNSSASSTNRPTNGRLAGERAPVARRPALQSPVLALCECRVIASSSPPPLPALVPSSGRATVNCERSTVNWLRSCARGEWDRLAPEGATCGRTRGGQQTSGASGEVGIWCGGTAVCRASSFLRLHGGWAAWSGCDDQDVSCCRHRGTWGNTSTSIASIDCIINTHRPHHHSDPATSLLKSTAP
jgi:hypothetical protein